LHLAAAHTMARVALLDRERLEAGDIALVRLILSQPIGALAGDRLVLRDTGATHTIGGGVVLDPFPLRRGRRTAPRLAQLDALQAEDTTEVLRRLLATAPGWTDQVAFMRARNVPQPDVARIVASASAVTAGDLVMSRATFESVGVAVVQALDALHRASPELPGLQPVRLRQALAARPSVQGFIGILEALRRDERLEQDGPWFRLPGHRVSLSPQDETVWRGARLLIAADRFRPPRTVDIAQTLEVPPATTRATLKRLVRMGRLVEIAPDQFFLRETVAEMAAIAADTVDENGVLTAATFRDRLNNGRKVAILILEFFDKVGVTIRQGDMRRIRRDRLGLFGPASGQTPG
jgi:selenocysteine-specific elongation factor